MISTLLLICAAAASNFAQAARHYEYDEMGIPQRVENRIDTAGIAAPYAYDLMGRPRKLKPGEKNDDASIATLPAHPYEYDEMGIPRRTVPSAAQSQQAHGTAAP